MRMSTTLGIVFLTAAVLLSCEVLMASPSAAKPQEVAKDAATWQVDSVHSVALFRIQHMQSGMFWGRINALEGTVIWNADDSLAPIFKVTAKLEHLDTSNERLDGNLKGPNFFNAKEFPELTFVSSSGTRVGPRHWTVQGDLTIHGVTKPTSVDVVVTGTSDGPGGTLAGFESTVTILRSDFGMSWGVEKPAKALSDEVKLIVSIEGAVARAE
ncbi:MAG: YceI family protein [Planctomycetota bacterium]|nr:YceI family protein [Planctomycetota bacterium]